jgi:hypothetical protein
VSQIISSNICIGATSYWKTKNVASSLFHMVWFYRIFIYLLYLFSFFLLNLCRGESVSVSENHYSLIDQKIINLFISFLFLFYILSSFFPIMHLHSSYRRRESGRNVAVRVGETAVLSRTDRVTGQNANVIGATSDEILDGIIKS